MSSVSRYISLLCMVTISKYPLTCDLDHISLFPTIRLHLDTQVFSHLSSFDSPLFWPLVWESQHHFLPTYAALDSITLSKSSGNSPCGKSIPGSRLLSFGNTLFT